MNGFKGKTCSKCGEWKPIEEYYKVTSSSDGRRGFCRDCFKRDYGTKRAKYNSDYQKEHREERNIYLKEYRKNIPDYNHKVVARRKVRDPEGYREYLRRKNKRYNETHPGYKQEYMKKYYEENKEKREEYRKEYYKNNKEKVYRCIREWCNRNPSKEKEYGHRKRINKLNNGGSFTSNEWNELCEKYGNRCLACGQEEKLTVDHVVPLSKGGTNSIDNIQPLCFSCNSSKQDKTIDYRETKHNP